MSYLKALIFIYYERDEREILLLKFGIFLDK